MKKKMRQWKLWFMAFAIVGAVMVKGMAVFAANPAAVMTEASGVTQQIVYLDVVLVDCPQIDTFSMKLDYDASAIELLPEKCSFATQGGMQEFNQQKGVVLWATTELSEVNGSFCELAFRIKKTEADCIGDFKATFRLMAEGAVVLDQTQETKVYMNCEHEWDNGTIQIEATPDSEGLMIFNCVKCNATKTHTIQYDEEQSGQTKPGQEGTGQVKPGQEGAGQAKPGQEQTEQNKPVQEYPNQENTGTGQTVTGNTQTPIVVKPNTQNNNPPHGDVIDNNTTTANPDNSPVQDDTPVYVRPGENQRPVENPNSQGNSGYITGSLSANSIINNTAGNQSVNEQLELDRYLANKRQEQLQTKLPDEQKKQILQETAALIEEAERQTMLEEQDRELQEVMNKTDQKEQESVSEETPKNTPESIELIDQEQHETELAIWEEFDAIYIVIVLFSVVILVIVFFVVKGVHFGEKTVKK